MVLAGGALAIFGVTGAQAGDPVAGQAKAGMCAGCHGDDGNSFAPDFPRLAGQYGAYIAKQIRDFQRGHRGNNDMMAGMAATVASVEDAKDIGAYFQSQKLSSSPLTPAPSRDVLRLGERVYKEGNPANGVYGCINCHGENGMGRAADIAQFPVVGAQHRDYLIKQLNDFRSGARANDPAGMMTNIAKLLTEEEVTAVAEYLSQITP